MVDSQWQLHGQLAADCHYLGKGEAAHLLLHRNASLHWLILVPETGVLDLLDLPAAQRNDLLDQAAGVANYLKNDLGYPRVNVGALGLVVPQLHLHVVGRRELDPCWPAPVWGNLAAEAGYTESAVTELAQALLN